MNFINAEQRAAQITERLCKSGNNNPSIDAAAVRSSISPEERERRRADVQSRSSSDPNERRFEQREKGLSADVDGIRRANVVSKNSNIISSSTSPSINATDRAAAIRKQRELDYAKSRGLI
jgi:hypothetical protein